LGIILEITFLISWDLTLIRKYSTPFEFLRVLITPQACGVECCAAEIADVLFQIFLCPNMGSLDYCSALRGESRAEGLS